jgi:hypothetical protein
VQEIARQGEEVERKTGVQIGQTTYEAQQKEIQAAERDIGASKRKYWKQAWVSSAKTPKRLPTKTRTYGTVGKYTRGFLPKRRIW